MSDSQDQKTAIDPGLSDKKAETSRMFSMAEAAFLAGQDINYVPPTTAKPGSSPASQTLPVSTNLPEATNPSYKAPGSREEAIVIPDNNIKVLLSIPVASPEGGARIGTFDVAFRAMKVELGKECLSLIMRSNIDIVPPTLVPFTLKIAEKEYSVAFAGSSYTIGQVRCIAFITIQ